MPEGQQLYGDLPDGRLADYVGDLSRDLVRASLDHDVDTMLAPDVHGIDGHPDHRTMFIGACMAIGKLAADHGRQVSLVVLDSRSRGSLELRGDERTRPRKLEAISLNASQMLVRRAAEVARTEALTGQRLDHELGDDYWTSAAFWRKMRPYHIERETYRPVRMVEAQRHVAAALSGHTGLQLALPA